MRNSPGDGDDEGTHTLGTAPRFDPWDKLDKSSTADNLILQTITKAKTMSIAGEGIRLHARWLLYMFWPMYRLL